MRDEEIKRRPAPSKSAYRTDDFVRRVTGERGRVKYVGAYWVEVEWPTGRESILDKNLSSVFHATTIAGKAKKYALE